MFRKEITTTADDYREIVNFTEYKLRKLPVTTMVVAAILAIASVVLGVTGTLPLIAGVASALVCCAAIIFFPVKIRRTIKNGIKWGIVSINAKRTLEFDGATLSISGGRTDTDISVPWHTVFAIYETEKCFFIYLTFQKAYCVQKNQLTPNEILDVRNYFIKKMGNRFYIKFKR